MPKAKLHITWVKSTIGYPPDQHLTMRALGLRRLHQRVTHPDSASLRGMLLKVRHLVKVERDETT